MIINALLSVVFSLSSTLIKILLAPIDYVIMNTLPDVNDMITAIQNFLTLCLSYVGWVIDAFGIPATAIGIIVSYFVLKYSILMAVMGIKIIIGWVKGII